MDKLIDNNEHVIENLIYEIRGKQVMLDSDLAMLYKVETKRINEAFNRNKDKFPERFSFKISEFDYTNLKSQFATSNLNNHGGSRKGHRVFTEQGVAMLATVLKSKIATQVSIRIMDAFVAMRNYIGKDLIEQKYINDLVLEDHNKIQAFETSFLKFEEKRKINEIYFEGQIYDAYSKIQDIFKGSKKSLIIIDSYADNTLLDNVKRLNVIVVIITKTNNYITKQDLEKYNKQYNNLKVIYDNTFHDRYFIIDRDIVYHCGASINRIGYKTFSINLINDKEVCKLLINKINKIINN